jgi:hypothetical protein
MRFVSHDQISYLIHYSSMPTETPLRIAPDVAPVHVRPELFTKNPATYEPLDRRAVFGWHPISEPALNYLIPNTHLATKVCQAGKLFDGPGQRVIFFLGSHVGNLLFFSAYTKFFSSKP